MEQISIEMQLICFFPVLFHGLIDLMYPRLDERPLTKSELRDFCALLLGDAYLDGMPDPSVDWEGFLRGLDQWLKQKDEAPQQWVGLFKLLICCLVFTMQIPHILLLYCTVLRFKIRIP